MEISIYLSIYLIQTHPQILDTFNIYVSNPLQSEHLNYNKFRNATELHIDDDFESIMSYDECKIVKTASIKSYCDLLRNYLKSSEHPPFLIAGPSGNGKRFDDHKLYTLP